MSLINEMLANLDARRPDRRQRHAEELRGLAAPGAVRAQRNLPLVAGACALALATAAVLGLYHFWLRPAVVADSEPARSALKIAAASETAASGAPAPHAAAPQAAAPAAPEPPPAPGPAQPEPPPAAQAGGPDPAPAQQRSALASEPRAAAQIEPAPAVPAAAASELALDEPTVRAPETPPLSPPEPATAAQPAAAAPYIPLQPTAVDGRAHASADAPVPTPAPEEIPDFPAEDAIESLPAGERVARSERPPSARAFAERSYRKGLELRQGGRGDAATRAFRDALEIDPAHLPAREALVDQLLQAGKLDEASAALADTYSRGAQEPRIARLAARVALQRGEPQPALEALQRFAQSPDAEYHALLAATYQRLGDAERAAGEYRSLLALEPDRPAHWLGLAIALERRGRGAEALRAYQAARARPGLPEAAARYAADRIASLQRDED